MKAAQLLNMEVFDLDELRSTVSKARDHVPSRNVAASITEDYFWSRLVVEAFPTADDSVKALLRKRFGDACERYVRAQLSELGYESASSDSPASPEQIFAETVAKVNATKDQLTAGKP